MPRPKRRPLGAPAGRRSTAWRSPLKTPAPTADPAARALASCPGLTVTGIEHRTGKAVLLAGTLRGRAVVAKVLTDPTLFWHQKFASEAAAYQMFAASPPPFPVPVLYVADATAGVLVIARADGQPAATDRYPAALGSATLGALLAVLARVRAWQPPPALARPVFDYADRLGRYRAAGFLDGADVAALEVLLLRIADRWEFAHGDALPSNMLLAGGAVTLIDWEFAGIYPPAYDLALLWVVLRVIPGARARIEAGAGNDPVGRAGFWTGVATVLAREVRTHRELPGNAPERARLGGLAADWAAVRPLLRHLARDGP